MVDLQQLKDKGCTKEKLQSLFTNVEGNKKIKDFVDQIRNRIKGGVERNIKDYRIYWAIDKAFDAPFYQLSYTMLQGLLDGNRNDDAQVLNQIRDWGLTHLLPDVVGADGKVCMENGKPKKAINIPVFYQIFIPLVCAYVTIRWAKLFNDRDLTPHYKYEPDKFSKNNRLRCEIITELVQQLSTNFDYKGDDRQAILQTLLYGTCFKFPREAWYQEKQLDSKGQEKIIKEGLRFNMPHPSRTYWDLFNRASSINTNTGMRFLGYWEICSYREIFNNPLYWNKDKISFGVNSWWSSAPDFLSIVYPCALSFPTSSPSTTNGAGALDRENQASYYTNDHLDKGTLLTQHFQLVNPKQELSSDIDYDYSVWFRFVHANDGAIVWAEPLAYTPSAYYGYDADQNRARNKSLALEVLPFQDLMSQMFSQWTLSTRQNLINPIFYNMDLVPEEYIRQLENLGEKMFRTRAFIPFSKTENIRLGENQAEAFTAPQFTRHDTAQIAVLIKGILDVLDRVLVLSSQEIGQSAPHEQTAEEVRIITHTTSTRLDFTGSFIDDGIYATKKMVYDAMMAYAHEDFAVSVSPNYGSVDQFKKLVKDLGLQLLDESDADLAGNKVTVKGKKDSLELETFASTRDGDDRIDNAGIAAAMAQIFQAVANNPVIIQVLGAQQLIDLLNQVIDVSGLPKEFKLHATQEIPKAPEEQQAAQQEQAKALQETLLKFAEQIKASINQTAQATEKAVMEKTMQMVEPIAQGVAGVAKQNMMQDAEIKQLAQAISQVNQVIAAAANHPAMNAPPMMQPQPTDSGLPENIPPPAPAGDVAGLA